MLGIDDFLFLEVIAVFKADGADHLVVEHLVDRDGLPVHKEEFDDGWGRDVDRFGELADAEGLGVDEDAAVDLGVFLFLPRGPKGLLFFSSLSLFFLSYLFFCFFFPPPFSLLFLFFLSLR